MFDFLWKRKVKAVIRAVEYLDLKRDDVIVLYSEQPVTKETRDAIYEHVKETLVGLGVMNQIVLLTHGMKLLLLRKK